MALGFGRTVEEAASATQENDEEKHGKECGVDGFNGHFFNLL